MRRQFTRILLALASVGVAAVASPPIARTAAKATLPPAVLQQVLTFHQVGKGSHSYFGLKVYLVTPWAKSARWNPEEPHALDLESNRAISKDQLTAAGMDEMIRLGAGTPDQLQAWRKEMERVLPSVNRGDQLVVFCAPNHKTFFFYNGDDRGEIDDPAFGAAFFSIWLDPRTKNPALRKSLLNH
jgi:Chalcone isomerase-like